jgi:hypothetical protein
MEHCIAHTVALLATKYYIGMIKAQPWTTLDFSANKQQYQMVILTSNTHPPTKETHTHAYGSCSEVGNE